MARWVQITGAAALLLALLLVAGAGAAGFRPASSAVEKRVHRQLHSAHRVFVNCPAANAVGQGLGCEFRVLVHGFVRGGFAIAEPVSSRRRSGPWRVVRFVAGAPASRSTRRCSRSGLGPEARRLDAHGVLCVVARHAGRAMREYVLDHGLRLPRRFTYRERLRNSRGFIVDFFSCRGRIEIRQGTENPYGHETAHCRTRFGDRFVFVFDQGS